MGFEISGQGVNKTAFINGNIGKYGCIDQNDLENSSIFGAFKYGANASDNFKQYNLAELGKPVNPNNPPALNYELNYSPVKDSNSEQFKAAAIGLANDDSDSKPIDVAQMTGMLKKSMGENATAEALDLNGDGKIDQAENAAYTLLQDACDNQDPKNPELSFKNIDGKITKSGHDNSMFVFAKNNVENNKGLLKQIYDHFRFGEAQNKLLGNKTAQSEQKNEKEVPAVAPKAVAKPSTTSPNIIKYNLKEHQTLGEIALKNKKALSEKYGTTKLWGAGGIVDKLAKANGYESFQDKKLNHLKVNNYDFKY